MAEEDEDEEVEMEEERRREEELPSMLQCDSSPHASPSLVRHQAPRIRLSIRGDGLCTGTAER